MKAIGYQIAGSIDRDDSFVDIDLPRPKAVGRDILVEVNDLAPVSQDTAYTQCSAGCSS